MKRRMLRIGVTGGIGSGKTTVCHFFEDLGVPVLYADDVAKSLSTTDPRIRRKIHRLLGGEAFTPDGKLNNKFVADAIFADARLIRQMNAILHPVVSRRLVQELNRLEKNGERIAMVEAALIYEGGLDAKLDFVIVVHTALKKRKQRASKRRGLSAQEIVRRQRAQWPVGMKKKLADIVIENNGNRRQLRRAVKILHKVFLELTDGKKS